MKKNFIAIILTSFFFVLSFVVTAQTDAPPPNPGGDPGPGGTGDDPLGGGAPIGGGTLILIGLGAVYGSKKAYKLYQENQEELED